MQYKIKGGKKLNGEIFISGNKNSILPCMAAALLSSEEVILENVPDITDVKTFLKIFDNLGVSFKREGNTLSIKAEKIEKTDLPDKEVTTLRASVLMAGPILSRRGKVTFHFPGGDVIGRRSINVHLEGFKALGISARNEETKFKLEGSVKNNSKIFLEEASVTATENLILASVVGTNTVEIRNCASEPHILDLCHLLIQMGAKISGVGTDTILITGVAKLHGTNFKIGCDGIEVATYAIASFITGGRLQIKCDPNIDLEPIMIVLNKFGLYLENMENGFLVKAGPIKAVPVIKTNLWPGFPTDLMSAVIVLASQANGVTLCHDWMYESRMFFVDKLISMGANITIADPHRVLVYGPSKLIGREVETPDIRAGMALVLAALVADGETIINKVELIERGYEDVKGKLASLGALIE